MTDKQTASLIPEVGGNESVGVKMKSLSDQLQGIRRCLRLPHCVFETPVACKRSQTTLLQSATTHWFQMLLPSHLFIRRACEASSYGSTQFRVARQLERSSLGQ